MSTNGQVEDEDEDDADAIDLTGGPDSSPLRVTRLALSFAHTTSHLHPPALVRSPPSLVNLTDPLTGSTDASQRMDEDTAYDDDVVIAPPQPPHAAAAAPAPVPLLDNNGGPQTMDDYLRELLEIYPDLEPEFAMQVLREQLPNGAEIEVVGRALAHITDLPSYPKAAKVKMAAKKEDYFKMTKPLEGENLAKYEAQAQPQLKNDFPTINVPDIRRCFHEKYCKAKSIKIILTSLSL